MLYDGVREAMSRRVTRFVGIVCAVPVLLLSCLGEATFEGVSMSSSAGGIYIGDSLRLEATAFYEHPGLTEPQYKAHETSTSHPDQFSWASSKPSVLTVDGRGVVRGIAEGSASVSVSHKGKSADDRIQVTRVMASIRLEPSSMTVVVGDSIRIRVTALDAAQTKIDSIEFDALWGNSVAVPINGLRQTAWSGGEVIFRAATVGNTLIPIRNFHRLPARRDTANFSLTVKAP